MTKACVLVFFQYFPRIDQQYQTQSTVFFNLVKKWADQIDHFYLANGGWEFKWLPDNITILKEDLQSHWHYLNKLTEMVKEDSILYLDPDILVYDPEVIKKGFNALKTHDAGGILDNSANLQLEYEFDLFQSNTKRAYRRRFTPYMTFIKTNLLKSDHGLYSGIDFTPVRDKYDSMGQVTHEIMRRGCKYYEFEDDRNTLRLQRDGSVVRDTWLDGTPYEWSTPPHKIKDLGYYHIRNSSVGLGMLKEFKHERQSYERRKATMPFDEVMRLLSWQYLYDEMAGEDWRAEYEPVLQDMGVDDTTWIRYIAELHNYYPWVDRICQH